MALITGKKIEQGGGGGLLNIGVLAAVVCLSGGMAMQVGGFVRPARAGQGGSDTLKAADVAGCRVVGMFLGNFTGGAADGDVKADIQSGEAFLVKSSAGVDAVTAAMIGMYCFVVDDETVASNDAGGTRPIAGVVQSVDAGGVMVEMGPELAAAAGGRLFLPFSINQVDLLAGTSAELVSPVEGVIARLTTTIQAAVTTGGPITAAVGVTAVDGLSIVIADAAAKGTVQTDRPTAGHASAVVAPGSRIQIIPDASFATAGAVNGVLEISF